MTFLRAVRRESPQEWFRQTQWSKRSIRRLKRGYGPHPKSDPTQRARVAAEAAYLVAEYRGHNKRKYVRLLGGLGLPAPRYAVDVGGSLPGMLRLVSDTFGLKGGVVADINCRFATAFKSPDRKIALIRADARALPFKDCSFDLVVSAFLLEHVPEWQVALRCMIAVGRYTLVAFGPNRWFPFEIGHLDAPLAGTLPKPLARYVAYAWLKATGRGRPVRRIREILDDMTYISSRAFRRECKAARARVRNVFPEMVELAAIDDARPLSIPRRLVRAWPCGASVAARLVCAVGLEPQMYYAVEPGPRPTITAWR